MRVDSKVVSELSSKVLPHQKITVERQAVAEQSKRVTDLIKNRSATSATRLRMETSRPWYSSSRGIAGRTIPSPEPFHPIQLRSLVPA